jgi:hypothetical protein
MINRMLVSTALSGKVFKDQVIPSSQTVSSLPYTQRYSIVVSGRNYRKSAGMTHLGRVQGFAGTGFEVGLK